MENLDFSGDTPLRRYRRVGHANASFIDLLPYDERDPEDWGPPLSWPGTVGLRVVAVRADRHLYVVSDDWDGYEDGETINTEDGRPIYQSRKLFQCEGLRLLKIGETLRLNPQPPERPTIKKVPASFVDDATAALTPSLWHVEKPTFMLGHLLASDMRTMFYGVTGAGKTTLALHMAAHVAAGRDFLRWRVPAARRVLYLDGEMPPYGMKLRYDQALAVLGLDRLDNLKIANRVLMGYPPLDTPEGQEWLNELIEAQSGFDLIVFDNLKSLVRASLISEAYWTDLQPLVLDLTKRGIGQLWVHHASNHNPTSFFGSDTPSWQLDTVMRLARIKSDSAPLALGTTFDKARWEDLAPAEFEPSKVELGSNGWAGSAEADPVKTGDADMIETILERAGIDTEAKGWIDRELATALCPNDPAMIPKTITKLVNARRFKLHDRVLHRTEEGWRWYLPGPL